MYVAVGTGGNDMYASRLDGSLFLLAVCVIVQHLPGINLDSPRHRLPLSLTTQVAVELGDCRNLYCEDHHYPIPSARGVCLRCREGVWDSAILADVACSAAVLLFSAHLNACASHYVWKPKSRRQFRTTLLSANGAPFPAGGRPENDTRKSPGLVMGRR